MKTLAQLLEIIKKEQEQFDFNNVIDYIDEAELEQALIDWTLQEYFEELNEDKEITNEEIIYYSNAIKYIQENDQSMMECFEIAAEFWYETKSLNSELLASLLKTRRNEEEYNRFIEIVVDEVENYYLFINQMNITKKISQMNITKKINQEKY